MKKYIFIIAIFLAIGITFQSCKKDYGSVGDYPSKVAGIKGTWVPTRMIQVDYVAKAAAADVYQKSFAADVPANNQFTNLTFTFTDNTFTITGAGYNFCKLSSGSWSFDANDYPEFLNLTNGTVTDKFAIIAPPREGFDQFTISYDRYSGGNKIIGYQYYLKKQ
ncbi:MAG: DUF5004 domain-containing protein [Bacteroidetes bacterium]|nr:DUF5004 domain-containing protein [Bacteroidota bacterium]